MGFTKIKVPEYGNEITLENGKLNVPDEPIIPFIEGDDAGIDIWAATQRVLDAAIKSAYGDKRKIHWMEVFAGEKSRVIYGPETWIPDETFEAINRYKIAIKGPMTSPHGSGVNTVNASLQRALDLYLCLRPIRYFNGVPSPVKKPEDVNITVFRESSEGIYAGIEFQNGTPLAAEFTKLLAKANLLSNVRFPETSAFGIKTVSKEGTERLIRSAIRYAIKNKKPSITLVHKGNVMKITDGNFVTWAYELAQREFFNETIAKEECGGNPPPGKILIKDVPADIFMQQILSRPSDFSIVATMNLNGDYISGALSAQVGGIGIAPGALINFESGHAIFEATHGTAPKYARLDKVNPSSQILAGAMMFDYIGWQEASQKIENAVEKAISQKTVTYEFARLMDGAREVKCSEFADILINNM